MEDEQVDGLADDWGGFLGLLSGFTYVGCEPWCIRALYRAPVVEIFRWATARAETIGRPAWTGAGLRSLHARPVRTSLGCRQGYIPSGHSGPHVSWVPPPTALQTVFGHRPIRN